MISKNPNINQELQERLAKLGLDPTSVWDRALSEDELVYLLDLCPFIQVTAGDESQPYDNPVFLRAETGWIVHDYGDAMSTSPGHLLFSYGRDKKDVDEDDDGGDGGDIGTLIKQTFDTALEIIIFAKNKGWKSLRFVDGHPRMAWAVWHHGLDHDVHLAEFSPTEDDLAKRERVKRDSVVEQKMFRPTRSKRP